MLRACLALFCILASLSIGHAQTVRMAVTTSFHNSGLSDALLPILKRDTGIDLQLLVVGTGQALKLGEAGDVDAVLVHSKAKEKAFVAAGFAPYRREIMFNDFVLVGPSRLRDEFANADNIGAAMKIIAIAAHPFVSRGDDSGTHGRELALWKLASVTPTAPWYRETGAGMGATWLKFGNKVGMKILFQGDKALANQYAFLPVSGDRHPHIKHQAVVKLEAWLTGAGQALINAYRIEDQQVFFANAKPRTESE